MRHSVLVVAGLVMIAVGSSLSAVHGISGSTFQRDPSRHSDDHRSGERDDAQAFTALL